MDKVTPNHCAHIECACEVASCCLQCPLPMCIHDDPQGLYTYRRSQYHENVRQAFMRQTLPMTAAVKATSLEMGVSLRTVYRAIKWGTSDEPPTNC